MSKELIERLRKMQREGWATDGEIEAADLIEHLTTENENLLLANRDCLDHFNVMKDDLAAAQAQRDELLAVVKDFDSLIQYQYTGSQEAMSALQIATWAAHEALATPSDTTALREMLKQERERCAVLCEEIDVAAFGSDRPAPNDCANAIRAMEDEPEKTPKLICPRCGVDRFKAPCPGPFHMCPIHGEAQSAMEDE